MPQTVHLIRHGQSTFNAACAAVPWVDPMLIDAPLSERGWREVAALRTRAPALEVDLVVTSPLTRAIQTALGAFADGRAPIVVEPLLRESLESSCDVGRSPSVLAETFPMLRFDHLVDPWWHTDGTERRETIQRPFSPEPQSAVMARIAAFRAWLRQRAEPTLAVVGHGTFFNLLTGVRLDNCEVLTLAPFPPT
ncbi:MAG: phosphoglycerate mutase family protein [Alphaproteobacteria bacterium]